MGLLDILAILISLTALLAYLNFRFLDWPPSIGLMLMTLVISAAVILIGTLGSVGSDIRSYLETLVHRVQFSTVLLDGMLGFLLFAGALQIDLARLAELKWTVGILATIGVIVSTAIVGLLAWLLFQLSGSQVPLIYCLVFGALIAPTDPISVLRTLKRLRVPWGLEMTVAGESLFNDGVGVVLFTVLLEVATGGSTRPDAVVGHGALLFLREAGGGIAFGFLVGHLVFLLLRSVDNYRVEVFLTLALVFGGFALAHALSISGPLAMVVAGLYIGNRGKGAGMSDDTVEHLEDFWELVDEFLTAILFALIGLEALAVTLSVNVILQGLMVVPIVLAARFLTVAVPMRIAVRRGRMPNRSTTILVWGGLKGGISVAMALSLPEGSIRNILVVVTYVVVVFSIVVQGLSIGPITRRAGIRREE